FFLILILYYSLLFIVFFCFKRKPAYGLGGRLVGSEIGIRDRSDVIKNINSRIAVSEMGKKAAMCRAPKTPRKSRA
ncbi:hypothetical protein J4536_23500, partial [Escherichia coli]|nr:hypothetical protein [Escherichia coli]